MYIRVARVNRTERARHVTLRLKELVGITSELLIRTSPLSITELQEQPLHIHTHARHLQHMLKNKTHNENNTKQNMTACIFNQSILFDVIRQHDM